MSSGRKYVLDANVFIEAHKKYYRFNICPGFWLALRRQHEAKRMCSIDRIKREIVAGDKWLKDWANDKAPDDFFKGTADKKVVDAFREMEKWVQQEPQFLQAAKAEFAAVADGWLVAYAKVNGLVVVTHEVHGPDVKKKVPIPNVCIKFKVEYRDTFEMLSELNVKFLLKKH